MSPFVPLSRLGGKRDEALQCRRDPIPGVPVSLGALRQLRPSSLTVALGLGARYPCQGSDSTLMPRLVCEIVRDGHHDGRDGNRKMNDHLPQDFSGTLAADFQKR